MAFSDFKQISDVQEKFRIKYTANNLFKVEEVNPLIILVEAKKNDFEQGWGQCLAELVAAQKINDDPDTPVYGIVSDGERWQFGKLTGDAFTRHKTSFSVDNIPTLFGAINAIFKAASTAPAAP